MECQLTVTGPVLSRTTEMAPLENQIQPLVPVIKNLYSYNNTLSLTD